MMAYDEDPYFDAFWDGSGEDPQLQPGGLLGIGLGPKKRSYAEQQAIIKRLLPPEKPPVPQPIDNNLGDVRNPLPPVDEDNLPPGMLGVHQLPEYVPQVQDDSTASGAVVLSNPAGGGGPMRTVKDPGNVGSGQPGFLQRLKAGWPGLLQGLIAAEATPSQYGGGPVDIFRAMQAGQKAQDDRNLLGYNLNRQRVLDELNRQKTMGEIGELGARTKSYEADAEWKRAQAANKAEPTTEESLYKKMQDAHAAGDQQAEEYYKNLWMLKIGHQPPQPKGVWKVDTRGKFEYNTVTGEKRPLQDPVAARNAREDDVRSMMGIDERTWPYMREGVLSDHPDLRNYILDPEFAKRAASQTGNKITAIDVAMAAARNDPRVLKDPTKYASVVLENMHPAHQTDPVLETMRVFQMQQMRDKQATDIENQKAKGLEEADRFEQNALAALGRGTIPQGPESPEGQKIRAKARQWKQMVMDNYTHRQRLLAGGDPLAAPDFEVGEDGSIAPRGAPKPQGPPPPPPQAPPQTPPQVPPQTAPAAPVVTSPAGGRGGVGLSGFGGGIRTNTGAQVAPIPPARPGGPGPAPIPNQRVTPGGKPIFDLFRLDEYAKANGMTPIQARQILESLGYAVQ